MRTSALRLPAPPFPSRRRARDGDLDAAARRAESALGVVLGASLVVAGAALAACAVVDAAAGDGTGDVLGAAGLGALGAGIALVRSFRVPARLRRAGIFGAVTGAAAALIALSSAVYLASGAFDSVVGAVFESTAGLTTTNLSVLAGRADAPAGIALWRAFTQWLGGLGAVVVVLAVTPRTGGDIDVTGGGGGGAADLRSVKARHTVRRVGLLYAALTASGIVAYLVGGMAPLEAVVYAMATASTGGTGTRSTFGAFDSAFLEWAAIVGMVGAGANYALFWRGLRGDAGAVLRSAELRAYAGLLVAGTVALVALDASGSGPGHEGIRTAAFTVASLVSTTGFAVADWGLWGDGAQVLLLVLIGVGAMSGSVGGGFRILRLQALLGYLRREVGRQLHPRASMVVKIGAVPIPEAVLGRMLGYQVLYIGVGAAAAVALAASGLDLRSALSLAISALSTVGPALGTMSPGEGGGAAVLTTGALVALLPVMVLGRLEIAPVAIGASTAVAALWRRLGALRRALVDRARRLSVRA